MFLIIDSRAFENVINCENIEEFVEKPDGKLSLVYYIPDEKKEEKLIRKNEIFDCCENQLMLKTFYGV